MDTWLSVISAVLLLLHHGREGAALKINSTSKVSCLTGQDLYLDISYNSAESETVFWAINGTTVASLKSGYPDISNTYKNRLTIISPGSLHLTNANLSDAGNYSVTVMIFGETLGTRDFQVRVFDMGSVLDIRSTSSGKFSLGGNLSLAISYDSDTSGSVVWTVNGSTLATWDGNTVSPSSSYVRRLNINGLGSLFITNMTQSDAGNYSVSVSVVDRKPGSRYFQVMLNGSTRLYTFNAATIVGFGIGSILWTILLLDNHPGTLDTKKKK